MQKPNMVDPDRSIYEVPLSITSRATANFKTAAMITWYMHHQLNPCIESPPTLEEIGKCFQGLPHCNELTSLLYDVAFHTSTSDHYKVPNTMDFTKVGKGVKKCFKFAERRTLGESIKLVRQYTARSANLNLKDYAHSFEQFFDFLIYCYGFGSLLGVSHSNDCAYFESDCLTAYDYMTICAMLYYGTSEATLNSQLGLMSYCRKLGATHQGELILVCNNYGTAACKLGLIDPDKYADIFLVRSPLGGTSDLIKDLQGLMYSNYIRCFNEVDGPDECTTSELFSLLGYNTGLLLDSDEIGNNIYTPVCHYLSLMNGAIPNKALSYSSVHVGKKGVIVDCADLDLPMIDEIHLKELHDGELHIIYYQARENCFHGDGFLHINQDYDKKLIYTNNRLSAMGAILTLALYQILPDTYPKNSYFVAGDEQLLKMQVYNNATMNEILNKLKSFTESHPISEKNNTTPLTSLVEATEEILDKIELGELAEARRNGRNVQPRRARVVKLVEEYKKKIRERRKEEKEKMEEMTRLGQLDGNEGNNEKDEISESDGSDEQVLFDLPTSTNPLFPLVLPNPLIVPERPLSSLTGVLLDLLER